MSPPPEEGLPAPAASEGFQLTMQVRVPAGEEHTFCQYDALPVDGAKVRRIEHLYTGASHHLLVYKTLLSADDVTLGSPFECDTAEDLGGTVLGAYYGSQQEEDGIAFPEGVALSVEPAQVVMTEYHVINPTDADVDAEVWINAWYPGSDETLTAAAGTLLYYHDDIAVPAAGSETVGMACAIPEDLSVSFVIPHTHSRGRAFRAWVESAAGVEPLLDESAFTETARFDPPKLIAAGSTIRFECDFENSGDRPVLDGFSAIDDEMCVLFAGYYRSSGERLDLADELCRRPGSGPVYGGSGSCQELYACEQDTWWSFEDGNSSEAELARHVCRQSSCQPAYDAWRALVQCLDLSCKDTCWAGTGCDTYECPACVDCLASSCADPLAACDAETCD